VVSHGNKNKIIEASIKSGTICIEFQTLKLHINMKTGVGEFEFSEWFLKLGTFLLVNYYIGLFIYLITF